MKRVLNIFLIIFFMSNICIAKGTLANKIISNQAQITYNLNGIKNNLSSNVDTFVVDQVIDVNIAWQDLKAIDVASGEKQRVLTFLLTNEGNGKDSISLSYEHNKSSKFKPQNVKIYTDSNSNGLFDGKDTLTKELSLNADSNVTLFIVADIAEGNYSANDKSYESLIAKSKAKANSSKDNKDKVDVVIRKAKDIATGTFIIRDYYLITKKSKTVLSSDNKAHTGSIIRYSIEFAIGGESKDKSIENIKLKDTLDSGLKYVANSIKLNSKSQTDAKDSDAAYFEKDTVYANIGTIKGNKKSVLTFDAIVK